MILLFMVIIFTLKYTFSDLVCHSTFLLIVLTWHLFPSFHLICVLTIKVNFLLVSIELGLFIKFNMPFILFDCLFTSFTFNMIVDMVWFKSPILLFVSIDPLFVYHNFPQFLPYFGLTEYFCHNFTLSSLLTYSFYLFICIFSCSFRVDIMHL